MSIDKKRWINIIYFVLLGTVTGFVYTLSVFLNPLSEKYGWEIGLIVLAFTVAMWVGTPANIFTGWLNDKAGPKICILIGGIMFGLSVVASAFISNVYLFIILLGGVSAFSMYMVYVPSLALIGKTFPDFRGTVTGIYIGGTCVGTAVMAPIAQAFIDVMSVTSAIALEGAIYGGICVLCALLIIVPPKGYIPKNYTPLTEEESAKKGFGVDVEPKKLFGMPLYYLIMLMLILLGLVGMGLQSTGSIIAEEILGLSPKAAAWVLTLINIGGGVGGFIFGIITDKTGTHKAFFIMAIAEVIACFLLVATGGHSAMAFFVAMTMLGLAYGGTSVMIPIVVMNTFGEKHFGLNFGFVSLQVLFSSLIGPQLSVRLDSLQFFLVSGISAAISIGVIVIVQRLTLKLNQQASANNTCVAETVSD